MEAGKQGRAFCALLAALTLVLLLPTSAQAATHPFLPSSSLDGSATPAGEFDKACGIATDSEGDVYVANSAKGEIDVFDSEGAYLTSIADGEEPCGLAVDGEGNLYALDTATSAVAAFAPEGGAYPPGPGQPYEAAVSVDGSGEARGIAVDPADDHLFVNAATKIVERKSLAESSEVVSSTIGEGVLSEGFGVGVWGANGNVYAADEAGTIYVFDSTGTKLRAEIDGTGRPGGAFAALPEAQIAVDQANGHVLVYDTEEEVADEFESTGPFVSELSHSFQNAGPSAISVDPSEGASAGRVYVTSGAGAGAEALAFGPLPVPTHRELPALAPNASETEAGEFKSVCGTVIDSEGDAYVMSEGTSELSIFFPEGDRYRYSGTSISDSHGACGVAVDSEGNVYVAHSLASAESERSVVMYPAANHPFEGEAPEYEPPVVIAAGQLAPPQGVTVNPANDHLFVSYNLSLREYDSAANGSGLLNGNVAEGLSNQFSGVAVDGSSGYLYVASNKGFGQGVVIIDLATHEQLALINGSNAVSKKPDGGFGTSFHAEIAIDQSNGHVYVNKQNSSEGEDVYEFEASGAYVSRLNRAGAASFFSPSVVVDNSGGPHARDLLVAGGYNSSATVDAYGPAEYGAPPQVETGPVSGADGTTGTVTLQGTINPSGAVPSACAFQYVSAEAFESTEFGDLSSGGEATCEPGPSEIGNGNSKVAVKATLSGLDSTKAYRYRLVAENSYGEEAGEARGFGPPSVSAEHTQEALYTEAILAATVDPAGLPTEYRCEYGSSASYGHSTAPQTIESEAQVSCPLFGLAQGTTYHYRVVASSGWRSMPGEDRTFTTLTEGGAGSCPNAALRTGPSSALPDCRAYELVTPATGGVNPFDLREPSGLNHAFWGPLASPDGEDLAYYAEGAHLAGGEGNGFKDGFRAHRTASGWSNSYAGPNGVQMPAATSGGFDTSHGYSFWSSTQGGTLAGHSNYLRSPDGGFAPIGIGQGSSTDPVADGRWISPGGGHVIFTSKVQLAPGAPPAGTEAVYDRPATGAAQLLSTPPPGASAAVVQEFEEEGAVHQGASADGSTVAFEVGQTLYAHRGGQTSSVVTGDAVFGGLSAGGAYLYYVALPAPSVPGVQRGEIFRYDIAAKTAVTVGSGGESVLVNVSADGSHAYFASPRALGGGAEAGKQNLYAWSAASGPAFVGVLADEDVEKPNHDAQNLGFWTKGVGPKQDPLVGFATTPDRSSAEGSAFAFASTANLTPYDAEGHTEIYLYAPGEGPTCISCNQRSTTTTDASFQQAKPVPAPTGALSAIPNLIQAGGHTTVFFESLEGLVPQDRNGKRDVYEWRDGIVSLISAGTGTQPAYLFGASADGRDVFFVTPETLLGADRDGGAPSVYDARIGGGFPEAAESAPCTGEECRSGQIAPAPSLAGPASERPGPGNVRAAARKRRCPRGRRSVRRHGKRRCVPKRHRRRHAKHHKKGHGKNRHGKRRARHGRGRGR